MKKPEIRRISFSKFAKNLGHEIRAVTEEDEHLWLTRHGRARAVVIPMRHEAVLHDVLGMDFDRAMHRFDVERDRHLKALWRQKLYRSELVQDSDLGTPPPGFDDAAWNRRHD